MRRILVTGANKGIGLAITKAILEEHADTFVYLASRDASRGREAAESLDRDHAGWKARIHVVALDVADERSVSEAAKDVAEHAGSERLYGIVNNAGINDGDLRAMLVTNVLGMQRVCDAFLPLVEPKAGRIVNVTSGSGPSFVATCTPERQRFFLDASMTWHDLRAFIDECIALAGDAAGLSAKGLGESGYGLSKALANTYTLLLAREHPSVRINACTPGFIETDMTRHYAKGQSPAEMGMKPPSEGAKAPMHLLFGELEGNGRYYGSDAKRSPLDAYRAPGSPPFAGP